MAPADDGAARQNLLPGAKSTVGILPKAGKGGIPELPLPGVRTDDR
jgi:hypothetical protein